MFEESTYEFDNGLFFDPFKAYAVLIVLGHDKGIVVRTVKHARIFHVVLVCCLEFKHGALDDGGLVR